MQTFLTRGDFPPLPTFVTAKNNNNKIILDKLQYNFQLSTRILYKSHRFN